MGGKGLPVDEVLSGGLGTVIGFARCSRLAVVMPERSPLDTRSCDVAHAIGQSRRFCWAVYYAQTGQNGTRGGGTARVDQRCASGHAAVATLGAKELDTGATLLAESPTTSPFAVTQCVRSAPCGQPVAG